MREHFWKDVNVKKFDVWIGGDEEGTKVKREKTSCLLLLGFGLLVGFSTFFIPLNHMSVFAHIFIGVCCNLLLMFIYIIPIEEIKECNEILKNNHKIVFYIADDENKEYIKNLCETKLNNFYCYDLYEGGVILFNIEDLTYVTQYIERETGEILLFVSYNRLSMLHNKEINRLRKKEVKK